MFDKFSNMFQTITGNGIVMSVLLIALVLGIAVFIAWRQSKKNKIPKHSRAARAVRRTVREAAPRVEETEDLDGEDTQGQAGKYPAYIITLDGKFDFDYIPYPVGDVIISDTTMPHVGNCYTVKEVKKEGSDEITYEAYDPRSAPVVCEESPTKAWFATHWDIVKDVYGVQSAWWKSTSLWIAAITGLLAFIIALATVGA